MRNWHKQFGLRAVLTCAGNTKEYYDVPFEEKERYFTGENGILENL